VNGAGSTTNIQEAGEGMRPGRKWVPDGATMLRARRFARLRARSPGLVEHWSAARK